MPCIEFASGEKRWYKNNLLHRDTIDPENGQVLPAIVKGNRKEWYRYGVRHRGKDLPSIETDLVQKWYKNGVLHRIGDKPAIHVNGGKMVDVIELLIFQQ